jgi:signal transduction histidine kinase
MSEADTLKWEKTLSTDAKRIHELMCLAAILIFPLFAFFDRYTIEESLYWPITAARLVITALVLMGLAGQRIYSLPDRYLTYFTFISISWFCCAACAAGGAHFLYQHNLAYCAVFLSASLFLLWPWYHSLFVILSSIVVYILVVAGVANIPLHTIWLEGGAVLLTIMVLHPLIIFYRFNTYRKEYQLKQELEKTNQLLLAQNADMEVRNHELLMTREQFNEANEELKTINQNLENLVVSRTQSLEASNRDLQKALDELDLFLYSSYHDLKGPIARLKGLAQLALRDVEEEKSLQYQQRFLDTLHDMEYLMAKLNRVSMLYHHQLQPEQISLEQYIRQILDPFAASASETLIDLRLSDIGAIVADEKLLHSVLHNLIENAFYYRSPERPHQLTISGHREGRAIIFVFRDNGCGIPQEVMPKIFSMFYRGHELSKGHGLGLYIVKKAVEKLQGTITVDSREGAYSEFKVVLPATA